MNLNLSIVACSKGPFAHSAVASVASHGVTIAISQGLLMYLSDMSRKALKEYFP